MNERCREATINALAALGLKQRPETVWESRKMETQPVKRVVCQALKSSGMSLKQIGAVIGQDHTSVIYHLRGVTPAEERAAKVVRNQLEGKGLLENLAIVPPTEVLACAASAVIAVLPPPTRCQTKEVAFKGYRLRGQVRLVAVQDQFTAEWRWEPE